MTAIATHLLSLPCGARFTARPIRPRDKVALTRFFDGLSAESRRKRFLGPKPRLTSRDLAFLTEVDGCRHVALVAVVDEWHGRGLGSALSEALLAHARRTQVVALTGSTLSENTPARALLRRLGFKRVGAASGVSEYLLPLHGAEALTAAA
jgi:GNAT superfamily N-acetyltransferase